MSRMDIVESRMKNRGQCEMVPPKTDANKEPLGCKIRDIGRQSEGLHVFLQKQPKHLGHKQ